MRAGVDEVALHLGLNETRRLVVGPNAPQVLQYIPAGKTYGETEDVTYLVSVDSVEAKVRLHTPEPGLLLLLSRFRG